MKQSYTIFAIGLLVILIISFSGCINFPIESQVQPQTLKEKEISNPVPAEDVILETIKIEELQPITTPTPEPTPPLSNVTNWDPYTILPYPTPVPNYSVGGDYSTPDSLIPLNITYSDSVGLNGYAIGKELNITNGPFSITYTVHPNISSPLDVWVKLTLLDPWQKVINEAGYNRGYSNADTQTMMIYREGRFYLIIEGDFVSMDYNIKTEDPIPLSTPVPDTE